MEGLDPFLVKYLYILLLFFIVLLFLEKLFQLFHLKNKNSIKGFIPIVQAVEGLTLQLFQNPSKTIPFTFSTGLNPGYIRVKC